MSCSNNCNQGRNCRCGPSRISSFTLALIFVFIAGCLGVALDKHDEAPDGPVVTDAQAAAMHEYMQELSVAKACRLEHGESLLRRTADGGFVCIPRNTKHVVAQNP